MVRSRVTAPRLGCALLVSLLSFATAFAGEAAGPVDADAVAPGAGETVSVRAVLAERGLTFDGLLLLDASSTLRGGVRRGTALRFPLGLRVSLETGPMLGWQGGRLGAAWHAHGGGSGSDLVGDFQGFDNADAERFHGLLELFYEQRIAGEKLRIKVGRVDANTEFALVEAGAGFLNSSAGFSPTIVGFPSFPRPAASVNVLARPASWLHAGAGVYERRARQHEPGGGLFVVGEAGASWSREARPGRLSIGGWGNHARVAGAPAGAAVDAQPPSGGYYLVAEQQLWRTRADAAPRAFVQAGASDARTSEVDRHVGAGLVWPGVLPRRPSDTLGLLLSVVRFSAGRGAGREAAVECLYEAALGDRLHVKADLQRIANPGGAGRRAALVGSLRAEIRF